MGRYYRSKPRRLAEKLLEIRVALGLSQNQMIRHLGLTDVITQSRISGYELGTREPALPTLFEYGRAAGVCVDVLIDDKSDLPKKLPSIPAHRGLKIRASKRRRSKP
ncbi:MAG: helix-turn-helix domain-containing protein [Pyrinomonadaceae bacterium]